MSKRSSDFPHPLYEKYVLRPFFKDAETYYYQPMLAANRTHVVMLHKCDIISGENARELLSALDRIEEMGLEGLGYQSGVEDLFFAIENKLIELIGLEYGGNLQLARSRNDLGYALTRLAIRPLILDVMEQLAKMRSTITSFAEQHLETIMPGYTHTQPAQPTTMAHYMAGVAAFLQRDMGRLLFAYHTNNQSPLGAAALTGTGFPVDRDLSARLLGFDAVMASTYDSIGSSDNLTDVASALTSLGVNLSRFTKDLLFWATRESGAIRIHDSFIQISSIMPQKRNPVVLEHIRARISRMLSHTHGIVIQCHNIPFGDTQDIEDEIFPLLFGSLETAIEILQLFNAVMENLHVNVEYLQHQAASGFTTVTELADTLVREAKLPFRQAHHIVSGIVSYALANQLDPNDINSELLTKIAEETIGSSVYLSDEVIKKALDPVEFVKARTTPGGSAASATAVVLANQNTQIAKDTQWIDETIQRLEQSKSSLLQETQSILS
jgi:argininosuccinate lyase